MILSVAGESPLGTACTVIVHGLFEVLQKYITATKSPSGAVAEVKIGCAVSVKIVLCNAIFILP